MASRKSDLILLREKQYDTIRFGNCSTAVLNEIFNTIPKNYRKKFMFEDNFDKALEHFNSYSGLEKALRECVKFCMEEWI